MESERFLAIESIKKKAADKAHLGQLIDVIVSANWRCRAPSTAQSYQRANQRRMEWMKGMGMDSGPEALILYLANQTEFVGASSLATTSAAYKLVNGSLGEAFNQIIADIVNARRREEALVRNPPKILSEKEIDQIVNVNMSIGDRKSERDCFLTLLSFKVMLRASEAAELRWSDLSLENGLLEVRIRRAKNDQEGLGRSSFIDCAESSTLGLLIQRLRLQARSEFVFTNLNNSMKLTSSAVSKITREAMEKAGIQDARHHDLRRSSANALQGQGMDIDQIRRRGRWKSQKGLARYLVDRPEAQGLKSVERAEPESEAGEAEEFCSALIDHDYL
uniref:Tyr recombinase domain-containing protein n=1 Tax=Caenorhabditis japonica TaxID=281687 RepID=A0A8R1ETE3_CAEJA